MGRSVAHPGRRAATSWPIAETASPPAAAQVSQYDRVIITPPIRTAAAIIPTYPMPTSGVWPSVAGKSTTSITASAVLNY
jgi:hypothetical protein